MKLPINWFDVVVLVVVIAGITRGRKRGLSEELVTMLQWAFIMVGCAFLYRPAGQFLAQISPLSSLFCYIASYLVIAGVISAVFIMVKRTIGGKLIGSDVFGKGEYYLGMPAGAVRFACILMCVLAIVNARFYTESEIKAAEAYNKDVYGSNFFPGLYELQQDVFHHSLLGPAIRNHVSFLLIEPTPTEVKRLKRPELNLP